MSFCDNGLTRRRRKQDEVPEGQGDPNRQRLQPHDEQALWMLQSKAAAQLQWHNEAFKCTWPGWNGNMIYEILYWEYNEDKQIKSEYNGYIITIGGPHDARDVACSTSISLQQHK